MTATLDVGLFAPSKNLPIQRMDEGGFLHVWNFQSDIEKPFRYMAKCLVWPNASRSAISIWQPAKAERTANVKRCTGHGSGSSEG